IEAFQYAERGRAFEPLSRILARPDVPSDFRARIHDGKPFGLDEVRQTLPEKTFLLQYAVLDDRTYVWVIWNEDSHRETLPVGNAEIERWTSTLQRLGSRSDVEAFREALAAPYAALLRKPLARIAKMNSPGVIPRVVIVPDRSMHGLPFAALRDGDRHVVQDYRVSVAASATLHAFSLAKDRQRREAGAESVLIVADPAFDERLGVARGLARLDWARAEAGRIEKVYEDAVDVEGLLDHRATSAEFLRLATASSIIHVAAHGVANPDIPSRSFLLFAPSAGDSGTVDAERLLRELRLEKARLAVLAACSSAGGMPVGPEGLAPLVRPLLVAGVPGIIGTLWNVRESSETSELLVRFHHHYRNGRDADDALRLAQLEMLGDPDLARSSAVAWAPFQATGYASSPFAQHTRR
ncbi:MAG: CHAT domain-containing protein, partial [Thermoanaerobaculia bacterium]